MTDRSQRWVYYYQLPTILELLQTGTELLNNGNFDLNWNINQKPYRKHNINAKDVAQCVTLAAVPWVVFNVITTNITSLSRLERNLNHITICCRRPIRIIAPANQIARNITETNELVRVVCLCAISTPLRQLLVSPSPRYSETW